MNAVITHNNITNNRTPNRITAGNRIRSIKAPTLLSRNQNAGHTTADAQLTSAGANPVTPDHQAATSSYVRDPLSALSHFIGFIMFICLMPVMLLKASLSGADAVSLTSAAVFSMSLVLLYGASTAYHTFDIERRDILKRIDHAMISILIAGSYTPVCLIVLRNTGGVWLLSLVWGLAILGLIIKMFFIYCPRIFSSIIYILLGWSCLLKFRAIIAALSPLDFSLLLIGGLMYTIGGVIYSMKFSLEKYIPGFGAHEVFHLFVLAGSVQHWIFIYRMFI